MSAPSVSALQTVSLSTSGYGPCLADGHGICAIGVPAGWVVEHCTIEPRTPTRKGI
ncbi:hypothetical protein GFY24_08910 [Nocardia sp. SYP-A9097]|uniref:hypothetical protein n=1 Tax=Nocardia sp. SYP-A9097 TaxID=2663237 RepID=UPI00129BE6AC|nr:hypothetical protein [Nocardia sp. SYP-A9097]MRH87575.1 hypothetical protein [Nocardia sp. SYP-A9097]